MLKLISYLVIAMLMCFVAMILSMQFIGGHWYLLPFAVFGIVTAYVVYKFVVSRS